jgi:hypothetical protein
VRALPVVALAAVCASLASAASEPSGHIVFASGTRAWVVNANGTGLRAVTPAWVNVTSVAISHAGRGSRLAFASTISRLGAARVWLMRPSGSGLHRLTTPAAEQIQPSLGR